MSGRVRTGALSVAVCLAGAGPAGAQLASPSTAALGMGENFTAVARGYAALAWNPADLGLAGNPAASLTILTVRGGDGIDPVTLGDLADYGDRVVPAEVKQDWFARIVEAGGQNGSAGAELTWAALQVGRFAFQVSTTSRMLGTISPGVAQLAMFGNVDAAGDPRALDFAGSTLALDAYSTAAAGFAIPIATGSGSRLSIGVTAKYTFGHVTASAAGSSGSADPDPLALDLAFPLVQSELNPDSIHFNSGSGYGVDVGVAWQGARLTVSAVARNVVNTFEWDESALRYRPLSLHLDQERTETDTDALPYDAAPAAVRERFEDRTFKPEYAVGAAYRPADRWTLSADVRQSGEGGMLTGPTRHAGAGLEFRALSWLPLRIGAAAISMGDDAGGYQVGGGLGLDIAGLNIAGSAVLRDSDRFGRETVAMVTVLGTGLP